VSPLHNGDLAVQAVPRRRGKAAHSHKKGLRTVALVEFTKGVLTVIASLIFLHIIRKDYDLGEAAQNLLYYLHVAPNRRLSQMFVEAAGKVMDANVTLVLTIAFIYATGRLVESYGLWRQRVWAEWLSIISGAVYLPFELYKLIQRPNWIHWLILLVNLAIVIYIAWVRWDEISAKRAARVRMAEEHN